MVSGEEQVFARVEPLLRDIGPNVFYVGAGEEARVLKLALNLMIAADSAGDRGGARARRGAWARPREDARGHGRKCRRLTVREVQDGGARRGRLQRDLHGPRDWKDLSLALAAAHEAGAPLPVAAHVQQLLEGCIGSGWGDDDLMMLLPRLRREAGL